MPIGVYKRKSKKIKVTCKFCNENFWTWPSRIKKGKGKFCSKKCWYKDRIGKSSGMLGKKHSDKTKIKMSKNHWDNSGKNHPNWKGGKIKHSMGYIQIYSPNHPFRDCYNYVFEHRLIVEKQINHYLLPRESTHHLNGIKDDNRFENLMAFTSESAHQRFHHNPDNVKSSEIIFDGRKFSTHV